MSIKDFVPEFTKEEIDTTKESDNSIFRAYLNEWDKVPQVVKKRIWTRRMLFFKESQGTVNLAPGFSFDSDSIIKI